MKQNRNFLAAVAVGAFSYTLVSATGGITGRFDLSNVTLPSGWVLRQRANKLILYRPSGIAITIQ